MDNVQIGVIGGSGLYDMAELEEREEVRLETPFGPPSDSIVVGGMRGRRVAFLSRHGRGHRLIPSEINYRANIHAMKQLGVARILSAGAVGSLREEIAPLDVVLPDQFVDRTRGRISTFFGDGLAAHIPFEDPVCPDLLEQVHSACRKLGIQSTKGGTYLCMEGPAFSTRAESRLYRSWGMDVIGMTNLQEAKLAREAEICYVTIALVTDYDCWHESHGSVSVEMILDNLKKNSRNARAIVAETIGNLSSNPACRCGEALRFALITDGKCIPEAVKRKLGCIIGKYVK